jgi:hypothetical protein
VWKRENVFVKIATPWPSAGMYRVYLMASDGFTDGGRRKLPSTCDCIADFDSEC